MDVHECISYFWSAFPFLSMIQPASLSQDKSGLIGRCGRVYKGAREARRGCFRRGGVWRQWVRCVPACVCACERDGGREVVEHSKSASPFVAMTSSHLSKQSPHRIAVNFPSLPHPLFYLPHIHPRRHMHVGFNRGMPSLD